MTLTSGYNAQHSLTSVSDNVCGNAGLTTYLYDAGQRLTTITTSYGGTAGPQVVTSYAPNNQISAQSRTIGGSGTAVNTSYSYDCVRSANDHHGLRLGRIGRLATYVYSYDKANRVTTMVDAEGTYTYTYDNSNELTNVDESGTQVESYSYDSERQPDRDRILDHGHERDADLAGRSPTRTTLRETRSARTAVGRSQRTRMIIAIA